MKETVKTSRTAGYLEKMFRKLNEHYFASAIEEPIITIQSTPRAYGHVTISKAWRKSNGDRQHELNLDAGTLDRPIEDVTATLLHEMVHLYHLQTGVQDCSRGGTYHNKCFKVTAEACDLLALNTTHASAGLLPLRPRNCLISSLLRAGKIFTWAEQTAAQHERRDAVRLMEQAHRPQRRKRAARGSTSAPAARCPFEQRAR